jgi:hypothetical protein
VVEGQNFGHNVQIFLRRRPIALQVPRDTRLIQQALQLAVYGRWVNSLPEAVHVVKCKVRSGVGTLLKGGRDELLLEKVIWLLPVLETDTLLEIHYSGSRLLSLRSLPLW